MARSFTCKYLVLLTYTPRKETDIEKYENWLINVDNPFFNSLNKVYHYSNWKVLGGSENFGFTYFDFLTFNSLSDFNTTWNSTEVREFTSEWRRMWGQAPHSDKLHLNARVFLLEKLRNKFQEFKSFVSINFNKKDIYLKKYSFKLIKSLRDEADFEYLKIEFFHEQNQISSDINGKLIVAPL
ncbi:MAG: hypothetical protein CFH01_00300 [Alphaproteobacteria bacterium MarineAlpha2_Bin1]|nr:MAG: hypothetical protein CFH01_00300 [Alphaproteobacteria bacterium MarineAlpha2_Bin1]